MSRVVAVVGGGISGLAAARALAGARPASLELRDHSSHHKGESNLEIVVLESGDRFGGKILSGEFRGRSLDFGPDNFLTRNPSLTELCDQLAIGDDLVAPATSSASVVARGALRPLPTGLILGLPPDLSALARSRIVSNRGLARAALDLLAMSAPISASSLGLAPANGAYEKGGPEWSAGSILTSRLGRELVERLVDPLLGGINAGAGIHGGARNNTQECVICHNPTLTDGTSGMSVNFAWQIHSIHRGSNLTNPYILGTTNYQSVLFPGDLRDCTECHNTGTYLVENVGAKAMVTSTGDFTKTTPPISAACQGCHDDIATASHALANTTALGESCTACHAAGEEFSVDRVHQRIF